MNIAEHGYQIRHLSQLLDRKVVGIVYDDNDGDTQPFYGLRFDNGVVAFIQCDPEGNAPGHLEIQLP